MGSTAAALAATDWAPVLRDQFNEPYWSKLQAFVAAERAANLVYPPADEVFGALQLTSHADVNVVVLGQDPYHGPDQANGLAFSVRPPVRPPPSLANIFKELEADLGVPRAEHGSLVSWAQQGVLLLNATLTVRAHAAASHQKQGWETFTDHVLRVVNDKPETVVFVLWGASARKKAKFIDTSRHVIIESPHPSPLSAHRGFFGSRPFSRINQALAAAGRGAINWELPVAPALPGEQ